MTNDDLPERLELSLERERTLRYGENPHQRAALYLDPNSPRPGAARARMVQGKELSYNNLLDADAAFECVAEFDDPAIVIVKHLNPCGVALGESLRDAYLKALACDPLSAFGGIVAANSTLNAAVAEEVVKLFVEVVIAPDADADALALLSAKPNVRVLLTGGMPSSDERLTMRTIAGAVLVQTADSLVFDGELRTASDRAPNTEELADMEFAYAVAKHVKSNAIVYAKGRATVGIGAGQMSRIDAARLAARKAADAYRSQTALQGSVMASDAFFPFPDVVEAAASAGATAIIQPGGSKNDKASIDAANDADMAMVFTGVRHFRH